MPELMPWQQGVIINSMVSKSSRDLSALLGVDEKTIADYICSKCGSIVTMDQKIAERKALRPTAEKVKKKKVDKPRITSAQLTYATPAKRSEKKYADREQKFSELIPVKIDLKTYIYVKPGSDIEKVKKTFLNNIIRSQQYYKRNPNK